MCCLGDWFLKKHFSHIFLLLCHECLLDRIDVNYMCTLNAEWLNSGIICMEDHLHTALQQGVHVSGNGREVFDSA